jgi:hypothetical protein
LLFAIASNFFFVVPTFFSDFSITSPMNLGRAGMGWVGLGVMFLMGILSICLMVELYIIPLFNFNTPLSLFD